MGEPIVLAANNPDLGGGELMLLRHAEVLIQLGHKVVVAAPDRPTDVLDAASTLGADVVAIRASSRPDYMSRLRSWDRARRVGLLWCHGLVPAVATTGHHRRIVHLHQAPRSKPQQLASFLARRGSEVTLVPSFDLAARLPGSRAHPNWTGELPRLSIDPASTRETVGYLGRLSTDKGVDVLARAFTRLPVEWRLVVAGDTRYVSADAVATVDTALAAVGDRVERIGHVRPDELFARARVVVFPSVWAEPFGLVVAEAMAAGVPFVITDAGAMPEVAGPAHPWVARRGDDEDLARVIERALTAPPSEVTAVTDRARLRWQEEYSPTAGRLRVRQLLDDLGLR